MILTGKDQSQTIVVDFYCRDLRLALEVDGITHLDEVAIIKDKKRQNELEILGVIFFRFDALLVVNKVESVVREIQDWIRDFEEKNGVPEYVMRRREKLGAS